MQTAHRFFTETGDLENAVFHYARGELINLHWKFWFFLLPEKPSMKMVQEIFNFVKNCGLFSIQPRIDRPESGR